MRNSKFQKYHFTFLFLLNLATIILGSWCTILPISISRNSQKNNVWVCRELKFSNDFIFKRLAIRYHCLIYERKFKKSIPIWKFEILDFSLDFEWEWFLSSHHTRHKMYDLSNIDFEKFSKNSKFNFHRVKNFMKFYIHSLSISIYISILFSKLSDISGKRRIDKLNKPFIQFHFISSVDISNTPIFIYFNGPTLTKVFLQRTFQSRSRDLLWVLFCGFATHRKGGNWPTHVLQASFFPRILISYLSQIVQTEIANIRSPNEETSISIINHQVCTSYFWDQLKSIPYTLIQTANSHAMFPFPTFYLDETLYTDLFSSFPVSNFIFPKHFYTFIFQSISKVFFSMQNSSQFGEETSKEIEEE